MQIVSERYNDIGRAHLLLGSTDAQPPEKVVAELAHLLQEPEVKGVLLVIAEDDGATGAPEAPRPLEEKALVNQLVRLLKEESIPAAAAVSCPDNKSATRIAAACHFQFVAAAGDEHPPAERAESYLSTLVARRPAHVVRAVMRSIHNGATRPATTALMRETQLFCELSARNGAARSQKEEP